MEGVMHDLGIDPKAIIIQALGFLVVFLILKRFAFGKVGKLLESRRNEIATRTKKLADDEREIEHLKSEVQQRLDDIEAEARSKMEEAVEEAQAERDKILSQTRREAEQELERARLEIQRAKESALLELRDSVADLAIAAVGRILDTSLDEARHRKLVDDFISQIPDNR